MISPYNSKKRFGVVKMNKDDKQDTLSKNSEINIRQYIDKFLDNLIYEETKERLRTNIDKALINKDRQEFYKLSEQYKKLVNR
jgi:uncharacterized protein YpiB (UPF0302 family)